MKKKRAQVGETITWFVGFVIIFFIIMMFMFITVALATKNPVTPEDKRVIEFESNQGVMFSILDSKISYNNEEVPLKRLVSDYCNGNEGLKEVIERGFILHLEDYYFRIDILKGDLTKISIQNGIPQIESELSIINCDNGKIKYKLENKK